MQQQSFGLPRPDAEAHGRTRLARYTRTKFLGRGGFAEVHLCTAPDGTNVALKSVSRAARSGGVNLAAIKELQALSELQGVPNVVRLLEAFAFGDRVHIVLEHCSTNLAAIARDPAVPLPERTVRSYMRQLLAGLAGIHARGLMHRDLKPDNVLVTSDGSVRLADFGHATRTPLSAGVEAAHLFPRVVSLWWRAPELLCLAHSHGPSVDLWAAGCILGELLIRAPLFPGEGGGSADGATEETSQMAHIVRIMGTPVDTLSQAVVAAGAAAAAEGGGGATAAIARAAGVAAWPGCNALAGAMNFEPRVPQAWRGVHPAFEGASQHCIDLLSRLLRYDPAARLTAAEALQHSWFAVADIELPS